MGWGSIVNCGLIQPGAEDVLLGRKIIGLRSSAHGDPILYLENGIGLCLKVFRDDPEVTLVYADL